jgi:hypothetical protein
MKRRSLAGFKPPIDTLGLVINFHEVKVVDGISRLILPGANREDVEQEVTEITEGRNVS